MKNIQNKKRPHNDLKCLYWERFEVMYKLFRLMGYIPYSVDKNNGKLMKSVKSTLWTVFTCCIQLGIIIVGNKKRLEEGRYWTTYEVVLESLERLMMTNTVVFFITFWWEFPKVIDYVNSWDISMNDMQTKSRIPLNCFKQSWIKVVLAINAVVVLVALLLDQILLLDGIEPILLFHYFFTVYFITLLTSFWAMNCLFISKIVTWLRDNIIAMLILNPTTKSIREFRHLWFQIQGQVSKFTESVRVTLMLHLLLIHIALIFNTYVWMNTLIYTSNIYRCIGFVAPQLFIVIVILSLCESSNLVSKESGYNFFSQILSLKYTLYQQDVLTEVDFLLEALEGKSSDMVLGKSIVVNRVLILGMVSTTLTYLVVLMQFYTSQQK